MDKESKTNIYSSPDANVMEFNASGVICSSIEGMELGPGQNDSTF